MAAALFAAMLLGGVAAGQATGSTDRVIASGWEFRSVDAAGHAETANWHKATVPGVVPTDLLANKLIPDPYYGENEKTLQWMGLTDWEYRTTVQLTAAELAHGHVEMVFDGLDTFADVYVNDVAVLHADNMFRTWRVDAKPVLRVGANTLRVELHSAIETMLPQVKAMAVKLPTVMQIVPISEEGTPVDPYVRKAPYSFGWDWGPRFVNEGIWKPVHLVTWDGMRVRGFNVRQDRVEKHVASLTAQVEVEADHAMSVPVAVSGGVIGGAMQALGGRQVRLVAGMNHVEVPVEVVTPQLWWPVGYGAQARYDFTVQVGAASASVRTGLRKVELRREKDAVGRSFTFVVNGVPVFAKGADVIPFDSFTSRVTPARHRELLQDARDAHMNMVREWGGGYYESDDFYDAADELGMMVWQEFMFGGEMVPGGDSFRANVKAEAEEEVDRLRRHPAIVLWCGNNEVETGWFHWGDRQAFKASLTKDQEVKVWQDYLLVMDDVLKGVVAGHVPEVPYTPSSPHGEYDSEPDVQMTGDMHYWAVWGNGNPVADYETVTPRFMSEYGFESFPEMRTLKTFAGAADMAPDSTVMKAHQKNKGGTERIEKYMAAEYGTPRDFASFVYVSQVQQAEAIRVAAEHLRRSRPRTMGSMYWQLNDSWPGPSWSSVDYDGRWKALQYYARRFYADVAVMPYRHDGVVETTVVNDGLTPVTGTLETKVMGFDGKVLGVKTEEVRVGAAAVAVVSKRNEAELLAGGDRASTLAVYRLKVGGQVVSERTMYFAPVKEEQLPAAQVRVSWQGNRVTLSSTVLARDVALEFGEVEAKVSDDYFDLLPGVPVIVEVKTADVGAAKAALQVMHLQQALFVP